MGTGPFPHDRFPKGLQWDDEGKVSDLGCCTGFLGECIKCCPPSDDDTAVALSDQQVDEANPRQGDDADEEGCVNSCYKNQCMGTGPFPHDRIPKGQQWTDEGKVSDLGCCTGFLGECVKCCPPSGDDTAVALTNKEVEEANPKQGDEADEKGCVNSCYKNQCMGTGPFPHDRIPKGQQWDDEGKVSDLGCCTGFLGECIKCCPPSDDDAAVALTNEEVEDVNPMQGDQADEQGCVNSCVKNQCMGTGPFPHDRIPKGQQWTNEGEVSALGCCTGFLGECIKCCPPSGDDNAVALTDSEVADAQQATDSASTEDNVPDWAVAMLVALPILSCTMGGALVYFMMQPSGVKEESLIMNQATS
jgi:hypothetical protein